MRCDVEQFNFQTKNYGFKAYKSNNSKMELIPVSCVTSGLSLHCIKFPE